MSAIFVLIIFLAFATLMYLRWVPALIAVPLMAVSMALVAGVPFAHVGTIVTGGAAALAPVYVAVVFGALLGRVTLDTGIARAMVNLAAEYGGERPFVLAMGVCAIVALLFTSLQGLGAIIMVGSIVLPIIMTAGVPRTIAATLFLMAFALGYIFNIANWTFYASVFHVAREQLWTYAVVLAAIDAIALVAYAAISFRRERDYATWAVKAAPDEGDGDAARTRVPAIALITPLIPLLLFYAFRIDAPPAFLISAAFGVLVTRPRDAVQTLVAAAIRGVEDVAPALLLFMGIGMLVAATKEPQFVAALAPLTQGGWTHSPIAYVVVFGLASPLALYRGPLNPFGVGIAIFTVLLSTSAIDPIVLVAAIMAVVQVQNVCDPTNTANVWVANFTGVAIDTITKRTLPYQVAVATLATIVVAAASASLFGKPAFAAAMPAALAQSGAVAPGFFASANASRRVAVAPGTGSLAPVAADATAQALQQAGFTAFVERQPKSPDASDCTNKDYAAYVQAGTSEFRLIEGTDLDVGLQLQDCGGWIVGEWHDHHVFAGTPGPGDARALALEGAQRLLDWAKSQPVRSANLFARGVAATPQDPPTYYFSLFKTVDGNMRLYVRGGGPAFVAGLRSGDVLDKLDGKFWWEYGTYQTQARAFDGRPHTFEIERAGHPTAVTLGAPFTLDEGTMHG